MNIRSKDIGVSPVIGVVLIVAITVSLVVLVTLSVFSIQQDSRIEPADASVELTAIQGGIEINVIRNENVDEFVIQHEDGARKTVTADPGNNKQINEGDGKYDIVAVLPDGSREVIKSTTVESDSSPISATVSFDSSTDMVTADVTENNGADRVFLRGNGIDGTKEIVSSSESTGSGSLTPNQESGTVELVLDSGSDETVIGSVSYSDVVVFSEPSSSAPDDLNAVLSNMSGTGSCGDDPYVITNDYELQAISADLDACYEVGNNIDASGTENWTRPSVTEVGFKSIGTRDPDEDFTGTLDGKNYTIKGLHSDFKSNEPSEYGHGLIFFSEGTIENLIIKDSYMRGYYGSGTVAGYSGDISNTHVINSTVHTDTSSLGDDGVGGLVGTLKDGGATVEYSSFNGTVQVDDAGSFGIGGLIGYAPSGGSVNYSYTVAEVEAGGNDGEDTGGIVGRGTSINKSYSLGSVSGEKFVAGILGRAGSNVKDSFSATTVSGSSSTAGTMPDNSFSSSSPPFTFDTYWDIPTSGQDTSVSSSIGFGSLSDSSPASAMTGADAESNMTGLDFENVWETVNSSDSDAKEDSYPVLRNLSRERQLKARDIYSG